MKSSNYTYYRYISRLYRLGKPYFDFLLKDAHLTSSQQYFLTGIMDHPGVTLSELSRIDHCDNATVTRGVRRLEDMEYVIRKIDENDARISHLYPTEKSKSLWRQIKKARNQLNQVLTEGFNEQERALAEDLLRRMSENALLQKEKGFD